MDIPNPLAAFRDFWTNHPEPGFVPPAEQRRRFYQVRADGVVPIHYDANNDPVLLRALPTPDFVRRQLAGAPTGTYDALGRTYDTGPGTADWHVGRTPQAGSTLYEIGPGGTTRYLRVGPDGINPVPARGPGTEYNAQRLAGAPPGVYDASGMGYFRTPDYWPGQPAPAANPYHGMPGGFRGEAVPENTSDAVPAMQRLVQMHMANQSAQGVRQAQPPALAALARQMTATMTRTPTSANLGGGRSLF